MDRELGVLFLAFVPGIVLVIAGAISAGRQYGIVFLWCLRFEPVREKLTSIVREMHPTEPVVTEPEHNVESEPRTTAPRRSASPCPPPNSPMSA
ncbi:MAG: hypothetical protein ACREXY_02370 [Gammaproteobacteria bacterium]